MENLFLGLKPYCTVIWKKFIQQVAKNVRDMVGSFFLI